MTIHITMVTSTEAVKVRETSKLIALLDVVTVILEYFLSGECYI